MGILTLLILLGIVPILIGSLCTARMKKTHESSLTFVYIVGILVLVGISELLSVPMTLFKSRFTDFVWCYNGITLFLCILAVLLCRYRIKEILSRAVLTISKASKKWIIVLLAIYVPVIVLSFVTPYIYGDDTTYLTMVNDILFSNRLYLTDVVTGVEQDWVSAKYALSSYWTWLAYLSKMSGIHPLILCKTILSYFFVPMSYAVQGLLAYYFFAKKERYIIIYMLLVILASLFGGFSNYTVTYRLYTWVWQSKAFLAMIVIPFLFYYCNYVFREKTTANEYVVLFLLICATCATTLTGTGLAVAMACVLATFYMIINRKIRTMVYTVMVCSPAYLLMILYLYYDRFMLIIGFH